MIAQKGRPLLSSWLVGAYLPHVLLDGPLAHMNAKFQELPTNTLSTPEPILRRQFPNQNDDFRGNLRLMRSVLRLALPREAKELTMPTQQSVWFNE